MPVGAKAIVLRDLPGNALAAKGSLIWIQNNNQPDDVGNGGGGTGGK